MIDYTNYVDTNIGTVGHLLTSTSPSVLSPHGAAVVAPLFRPGMKDRYNSDKIFGFSAGLTAVMPTAYEDHAPDYMKTASVFDHDMETVRPDFYEVLLEDHDILERHTAYKNTGVFSFTFPESCEPAVVFYTKFCTAYKHDGNLLAFFAARHKNDAPYLGTIFALSDVVSVEAYDITTPQDYRPHINEEAKAVVVRFSSREVTLPFAVSSLSMESLFECAQNGMLSRSFDEVRSDCNAAWNDVLGKVRVQGGSESHLRSFYTAIYRAASRMHNYSVNGKYKGFDGKIHDDEGHGYYCDDGIWDTFRGMHPLQLLLEPQVHEDTLCSYLRMYEQSGWLPRFPYLNGNIPCMLGHHTVSLFAEAAAKGVAFDLPLAYEAAYKNATKRTMLPWRDGEAEDLTKCYYENGFFPGLEEDEEETCDAVHEFENRQSVAVTIEHSYDDWCVAQLAAKLGHHDEAALFLKRALNYQNVYNKETGFMHPKKADGTFTKEYNPKFCGGQGGRKYFAENNAYIYNFAAQHDIPGTVEMMGGKDAFAAKLDNLYVEQYDGVLKSTFLMQYPDATGLMGQFCMGNEPSFHIPYLYNYCGQAYKTQRKIHEIIDMWFPDSPLGICGDEDGGAMSAWMAFSAMGFYPVNPASGNYDIGSPIFDRVELTLPNGKVFTVIAEGASGKAKYIQSASLNGKPLTAPLFSHAQMMEGGELRLIMGERPNKALFAE